MLNVLLVDNDKASRQKLSNMIKGMGGCQEIGCAEDGVEAIYKSCQLSVDIVLIDIALPKMNGLEAIKQINRMDNPPSCIITTSDAYKALEAYQVHAISYLLKPIRENKLTEAISQVRRYKTLDQNSVSQSHVLDVTQKYHVCCCDGRNIELIGINDIAYFHAENKYTKVHHQNGRIITNDQSLCFFMAEFKHWLMQVRRNIVVNKSYINGLEIDRRGSSFLKLKGFSELLPVSRRNLTKVRHYMLSHARAKHPFRMLSTRVNMER